VEGLCSWSVAGDQPGAGSSHSTAPQQASRIRLVRGPSFSSRPAGTRQGKGSKSGLRSSWEIEATIREYQKAELYTDVLTAPLRHRPTTLG